MSQYTNYPKGSEWRRWDLHIHTPDTKKNDQFTGSSSKEKWEKYIADINSCNDDIAVVAITDYLSIDNYFKFKKYITEKAITKKFEMVLPNIELRISPVTKNGTAINIHCIFNPAFEEKINDRFLARLSFPYDGRNFSASRAQLVDFGRAHSNNTGMDEKAALEEGVSQYVIGVESLLKIFKEDSELRENTIIVVSNSSSDGASGLEGHSDFLSGERSSSLATTRQYIYQCSDAIFSSNDKDILYFTGRGADSKEEVIRKCHSLMPCFHGCDAHENSKIFKPDCDRYCWIKADPTFEGLKQTLYEPEGRVRIQSTKPEDKSGYQVIDRIEISSDDIFNKNIMFNDNLNSVIGGRSSGKSVLLRAIASKVKTSRQIERSDKEYTEFVEKVSNSISVVWKDGVTQNEREVEYFEQGYMHRIAREQNEFNRIVVGVLDQRGKEQLRVEYSRALSNTAKEVSGSVNDYFGLLQAIKEKEQKLTDIGDRVGIGNEINRLRDELGSLPVSHITDDEKKNHDLVESELTSVSSQVQLLSRDIDTLETVKSLVILKDNLDFELVSLSQELRTQVNSILDGIRSEVMSKWDTAIRELITKCSSDQVLKETRIKDLREDLSYRKVQDAYKSSTQLSELDVRIRQQSDKLGNIESIINEISSLRKQLDVTKDKIVSQHKIFYEKTCDIVEKLSDSKDGLEITASCEFMGDRYNDSLSKALNLQSYANQQLANYKYNDFDSFESYQIDLLDKLAENKLSLKGGFDSQTVSKELLSTCFFDIKYDIIYEGDDFRKMSDGKKAFVVLKLLLDFSEKNCPILIDQPEDDLDNRAIYNDLVRYLREKKKVRQIIVATHNPNIVVGADSELIICANQNGERNINEGIPPSKFQYVAGSLEHTFSKKDSVSVVLESQGIREHVCEILEGGNIAFKLREKKYCIKL